MKLMKAKISKGKSLEEIYPIVKRKKTNAKLAQAKGLRSNDPIWTLIGRGSSGIKDLSRRHDYYLSEGERKRWRKSKKGHAFTRIYPGQVTG